MEKNKLSRMLSMRCVKYWVWNVYDKKIETKKSIDFN